MRVQHSMIVGAAVPLLGSQGRPSLLALVAGAAWGALFHPLFGLLLPPEGRR